MRVISKTPNRAIVQIWVKSLEIEGFDKIWDAVRDEFSENQYELINTDKDNTGEYIYFEFNTKEINKLIENTNKKEKKHI